jgi:hypothetical protein
MWLLAYRSVRCQAPGEQLVQHDRVGRRPVGDHLHRPDPGRRDGTVEEPSGRHRVTAWGHEHVDDLPELVDRAVHIAPLARDLDVGLVDLPATPDRMAAGAGGLGQQWREALDPPVDAGVVDLDAALGEEFFEVAVRQAKRRYQRTASTITSGG